MASSIQPSSSAGGSSKDSLSSQLAAAGAVILANEWAAKHQYEHAVAKALQSGGAFDHMSAGRFLVEHQVLSREQAQELEEVLKNQPHFPNFRLLRKLGSGGMGTVFLAEQIETQRQVALKTMNAKLADDKDFVGRFHREAKALRTVRHPNIAEIVDSGEDGGHCWLAMEFINGPSLMHLLKDYQALPEAYALRLIKQIAEGLGHVWNKAHLIHRDIKPENILVIRNRQGGGDLFPADDLAKLIDFGLVKAEEKDDRLTQTGMTIGTPLYMSPEQVRGEKLDCRSDIYGLGATLFHLLTGYTPFTGSSPGSIMSAHLTEPVPDPGARVPSLSQATRDLVKMSMAKDVKDRFTTCEALAVGIEKILQTSTGKSGGTMRLLRKPMVLNKPQPTKKSGSETISKKEVDQPLPGFGSAGARPTPASAVRPPSTRIEHSTAKPTTQAILKPATAPLVRHDAVPDSGPATNPTTRRTKRSTVFDEDPDAKLHIGILPWIVLGLALLGLVAYWLILRD